MAASPLFNAREEHADYRGRSGHAQRQAESDKALWETMKRLFSDAEIVEITMASAMFNMINASTTRSGPSSKRPEYIRRQGNAVKGVDRRYRHVCEPHRRVGPGAAGRAGRGEVEIGRGAKPQLFCGGTRKLCRPPRSKMRWMRPDDLASSTNSLTHASSPARSFPTAMPTRLKP